MTSPTTTSLARLDAGPTPPADAAAWLGGHLDQIRASAAGHGAVLIRGLGLDGRAAASAALRQVIGEAVTEREGFAPRDRYGDGVHSSSHWPADQPMCMHNELSYAAEAPGLMAFACLTPPTRGGVTALADTRAVLRALPAELAEPFRRDGWLLTRHFNPLVGLPWQDAFGTDNPRAVDEYAARNAIDVQWDADGGLHTRQLRPAVVAHPGTGEHCWFNQIAFLNEWTMAPEVREFLTQEFGPEGLPFNTFHADGTPLDKETVDLINEVYEQHTVREPWQRGDLMVVDNIRMAHSREPYEGEREILVGLGEPFRP